MILTLPPFTRVPTQAPIEDVVAEPAGRPLLEAAQVHLLKFLIISTACKTGHEAKAIGLTITFGTMVDRSSVKVLDCVTVLTNESQDTSHRLFV